MLTNILLSVITAQYTYSCKYTKDSIRYVVHKIVFSDENVRMIPYDSIQYPNNLLCNSSVMFLKLSKCNLAGSVSGKYRIQIAHTIS
jgi:hypothetical protein